MVGSISERFFFEISQHPVAMTILRCGVISAHHSVLRFFLSTVSTRVAGTGYVLDDRGIGVLDPVLKPCFYLRGPQDHKEQLLYTTSLFTSLFSSTLKMEAVHSLSMRPTKNSGCCILVPHLLSFTVRP
jgi:hypothetical protein